MDSTVVLDRLAPRLLVADLKTLPKRRQALFSEEIF